MMKFPLYTILLYLAMLPFASAEVTFPNSPSPIGILPQQPDCSHLYPVRSADDLAKQFYENSFTGCLLDIDPKILSEKWALPVYIGSDFITAKDQPGTQAYSLYHQPYQKAGSGFVIVRDDKPKASPYMANWTYPKGQLSAYPTESYLTIHKYLFPENKLPLFLPPTQKMKHLNQNSECTEISEIVSTYLDTKISFLGSSICGNKENIRRDSMHYYLHRYN
ncbi:hypothetical protein [Neisseria montereyensis]|uniref:Uncharacterized protein n=1 Tax=Neisseria montereyensis TaxID=2973938 RepID=A0ABT2FDD0_9NEIS|nr:hypothetical protein [Neisseria montereyensis]MCS4533941.1 hypothetical protein [Neisseria montereyensis]